MKDLVLLFLGSALLMGALTITLTISLPSAMTAAGVALLAIAGCCCIAYSMHLQGPQRRD